MARYVFVTGGVVAQEGGQSDGPMPVSFHTLDFAAGR